MIDNYQLQSLTNKVTVETESVRLIVVAQVIDRRDYEVDAFVAHSGVLVVSAVALPDLFRAARELRALDDRLVDEAHAHTDRANAVHEQCHVRSTWARCP